MRKDFPAFQANQDLVYLDSAASALKPLSVIEAMGDYYRSNGTNIHRGLYSLSEKATAQYESARDDIASFIHAPSPDEIIFTRSTTESLNLLAYSLLHQFKPGTEIITSLREHHSNFVPWQVRAKQEKLNFIIVDVGGHEESGVIQMKDWKEIVKHISTHTKLCTIGLVSNSLGTVHPVKDMIKAMKKKNPDMLVCIDGAQAIAHIPIDVQDIGCDFFAFSGHKLYGPNGIGVLWGKKHLLETLEPFQYGGDMIESVAVQGSTFMSTPTRFEAGTPHIAGAIGLSAAIGYVRSVGYLKIAKHEDSLTKHLDTILDGFEDMIHVLKTDEPTIGIRSFITAGVHPHDVAQILAEDGIAVRAGHHCTMPLHTNRGIPATTRVSLGIYNTEEDIEKLDKSLKKVMRILKK